MKSFCSVALAAAALAAASGENSPQQGDQGKAVTADCLADFNTVREQAGLEAFTAETAKDKQIPIGTTDYVNAICESIQKGEAVSKSLGDAARTGTYAYAPQTGSTADCSAAASFWKEAHVNFKELPEEYKSDQDGVYADSKNRSLVALYNPNKNATLDCAYFTCPVATMTTTPTPSTTGSTAASSPSDSSTSAGQNGKSISDLSKAAAAAGVESQGIDPKASPAAYPFYYGDVIQVGQQDGPTVRRLETSENSVMGLVCLTNPAALVADNKPFSEDVWANIKKAIENSTPSLTQSALFASALLVLATFIAI